MDLEEENKRISLQVTAMSTQLMESIDKQSQLEEKLNNANRTIGILQTEAKEYSDLKSLNAKQEETIRRNSTEIKSLNDKIKEQEKLRSEAEGKVEQLEGEVEDLTASLFAEANNMVADARKEKHTTEILNRKLLEAMNEKDNALETMKAQLKHMKKLMEKMEENSESNSNARNSIIAPDSSDNLSLKKTATTASGQSEFHSNQTLIYSPNISSIRYDLSLFQEFLKFIKSLDSVKIIRDTTDHSKLLRRIINDEINPVLKIDNAYGFNWLVKKNLMNNMIDGLVIVEPLSGVNEMYHNGKLASQIPKLPTEQTSHLFNYPVDSPPIAVHTPCSFCGESRDDGTLHARMYTLKIQSKDDNSSTPGVGGYPLCLWCLSKVRQTCDIFAFLRSLKLGAWNLENLSLNANEKPKSNLSPKKTIRKVKEENRLKRNSFIAGLGISQGTGRNKTQVELPSSSSSAFTAQPNTNIERAWLQLCKLRSMLHWSHIGIWAVENAVSAKIGPLMKEDFENLSEEASLQNKEVIITKSLPPSKHSATLDEPATSIDSSHEEQMDTARSSSIPLSVDSTEHVDEAKSSTTVDKGEYLQDTDKSDTDKIVESNVDGENDEDHGNTDGVDDIKRSIDIIGDYDDENSNEKEKEATINMADNSSESIKYDDAKEDI